MLKVPGHVSPHGQYPPQHKCLPGWVIARAAAGCVRVRGDDRVPDMQTRRPPG
ncbi:hypothetical protein E2C01_077918 [Portunus trituberculatus]|uniref:Uncharacterized protein n=1 Tax=Portunus trituberculatus TaxID=210409 RepID=A0A5B7INI5_PORTR|nr:hypothetical protein [Portunus trituberculatus]